LIDRKKIINELVKLLENEDNVLNEITTNNEHQEIYSLGNVESVLTGHRTITINLVNMKQHQRFLEKLHIRSGGQL
jgi:hypothetical protein